MPVFFECLATWYLQADKDNCLKPEAIDAAKAQCQRMVVGVEAPSMKTEGK